jgi:hypothetical protein
LRTARLQLQGFRDIFYSEMLAKKTTKNQITLPVAVVRRFPGVEYFDVRATDDSIVLTPLRLSRAEEVREKLQRFGITEDDLQNAVHWSRESERDRQ